MKVSTDSGSLKLLVNACNVFKLIMASLNNWLIQENKMNFDWQELHTQDFDTSVAFYGAHFNCTIREVPGRNGKRYGLIIPHGSAKPMAGIFETGTDHSDQPHMPLSAWVGYVTVDNVAQSVERALADGAKELVAFDIPYIGSVSVLKDPAGQMINLIEYKATSGAR
ncbi:VOC family protein [Shewanella eurypsychrophilus]|uniref:VOC family protein n=1 Tax=Shewanella eurypsychrophilus TaxID=2593656 RepID=A0ABX6VAH7_9GAMM|nr:MULTISPECIES: VOC family protein [Shewanella]QFU23606.1 VOC family protein [Shewanella sp. YLB-09]QPG58830.1 VOC family protein [Shewanella eurypsychrophilus]